MPQKTLLPLVLIALWCPSLPAAQDIETIIITASRIPQPLHTVGSSVTVIDLDDWRGTGTTHLERPARNPRDLDQPKRRQRDADGTEDAWRRIQPHAHPLGRYRVE